MNLDNKILTINDKKYIIIENVEFDNKKYVYLVNRNDSCDVMFKEIKYDNGLGLYKIELNLFEEKIYPLFLEKFKKY